MKVTGIGGLFSAFEGGSILPEVKHTILLKDIRGYEWYSSDPYIP
jgi:hypothetical protein